MRNKVAELLCVRGSVKRNEEPFCGRRGIADKREVEAGVVVGAGKLRQITRGQAAFNDMQRGVTARWRHADHSNDSDGHDRPLR